MSARLSDFPKTAELIKEDRARGFHIGGQLYISRGGKILLSAAWGDAGEYVSMREDSLMLWLSSGKPLTAILIAMLYDRDEVKLDDKVTRFIPEFGQGGKESITVAHILTHTGGFRTADKIPPQTPWDETIQRICSTPLEPHWQVGQKAGYHISGSWFILGEIIHRVSGKVFPEYLREELLQPLDMTETWNGIPKLEQERYGKRLALMHNSVLQPPAPMPLETPELIAQARPGSNTRGPISELGRFYEMLLNKGSTQSKRLLKEHTVEMFVSPQRIGMHDHTFMHPMDWGYGFLVNNQKKLVETMPYSFGRHASQKPFGHGGAQSSCGFCDPEHELVIAWALNGMAGEKHHSSRARELNSALYEDIGIPS